MCWILRGGLTQPAKKNFFVLEILIKTCCQCGLRMISRTFTAADLLHLYILFCRPPHPNPLPQGAREPSILLSLDGRG